METQRIAELKMECLQLAGRCYGDAAHPDDVLIAGARFAQWVLGEGLANAGSVLQPSGTGAGQR